MTESHRQHLVAELVDLGCIRTRSVADAFARVARERFVPSQTPMDRVYGVDVAIPTHFDDAGIPISSSSAPRIMAVMLEMLRAEPGQRVLEIGAGTGYNAALLSHLVGPGGSVTSIDIDKTVAAEAVDHLAAHGVKGVSVLVGDGWLGRPGQAFDRIIATAECWDISPAWFEQLREGGFLVLPLWLRPGLTLAVAFEKTDSCLKSRSVAYCGFMPLRGAHGSPALRAPVPRVPWDKGADVGEHRWLAIFDETTQDRVALVESLLTERGVLRPSPILFPGWNFRLAFEQSGPICFVPTLPPLRHAFGLFDSDLRGLAVVHDGSIHSFGQDSCAHRLSAFLSRSSPLDVEELTIHMVPHDASTPPTGSVSFSRPNFDIRVKTGRHPPLRS